MKGFRERERKNEIIFGYNGVAYDELFELVQLAGLASREYDGLTGGKGDDTQSTLPKNLFVGIDTSNFDSESGTMDLVFSGIGVEGQQSVLFPFVGTNEPFPFQLGLGSLGLDKEVAAAANFVLNLRMSRTVGDQVNQDFLSILEKGLDGVGNAAGQTNGSNKERAKFINENLILPGQREIATLGDDAGTDESLQSELNQSNQQMLANLRSILSSLTSISSFPANKINIKNVSVYSSDGGFTLINNVVDADGNEVPVQLIEIGDLLGSNYNGDIAQFSPPTVCGIEGHTANDGLDHTLALCGVQGHSYNCDGMTHSTAPCGHLWCQYGSDAYGTCGVHYICPNTEHGDHGQAACGLHNACDGANHGLAACGLHYVCDGKNHGQAACGAATHFVCDWMKHEKPACGLDRHCVSDGKNHAKHMLDNAEVCGGYLCDGNHGECAVCGGFLCVGTHGEGVCNLAPCGIAGHTAGDGTRHTVAACGITGHFNCDGKLHREHIVGDVWVCNKYLCTGDHSICGFCNEYACIGGVHGLHYVDGVRVCLGHLCDGENHGQCEHCGGWLCAASHNACPNCNNPICVGDHSSVKECNGARHTVCDGKTHEKHIVDGSEVCGRYLCAGDHGKCPLCGGWLCTSTGMHGAAACGTDGHCSIDGNDHGVCGECNGRRCNDKTHKIHMDGSKNICSGYLCVGDHGAAACGTAGHFNCDGKTHTAATCGTAGHFVCDDKTHTAAVCGTAGHCIRDGKTHTVCAQCDQALCNGLDHGLCSICGNNLCTGGAHGAPPCGITGHCTGDGAIHDLCNCGRYSCNGESHVDH